MKYLLTTAIILFATSVLANDAVLSKAENWFADLDTAQSRFEQIAYDGTSMRGTFYINRPGRLRFEYDAPTRDYIVADGFQIHFYDSESDQYNSGPIGATLADFILRDNLSFNDDAITVQKIEETDSTANITVFQSDQDGMGTLTLSFKKEPFALKSWTIEDAQGLTTSVILNDFDQTARIDPSLFTVDNRNLNE
jgi:outer membrane lipoprotein-sorting protein